MNVAEVNTSKIIAMLLIVAISFFTNLRVICRPQIGDFRPQIGDLLFNSISFAVHPYLHKATHR